MSVFNFQVSRPITYTSLSSSEYEAMWLNQRRAWRNLAGGGTPTATNIATSACDGTYLGGTEGKERRKVVGAGNEGKGGACRILENTILRTFNLPLNVAPFCEVIIQGPEASI